MSTIAFEFTESARRDKKRSALARKISLERRAIRAEKYRSTIGS